MKKSDLNKLLRAVDALYKARTILEEVEDNVWKQPTEWIHVNGCDTTTFHIIQDLRLDVHSNHEYAVLRLNVLKETLNN